MNFVMSYESFCMSSLILFSLQMIAVVTTQEQLNDRPVIGVLSQEEPGSQSISFIASNYFKFLESAGARGVPIMLNKPDEYYSRIINKTNGLILPGGGRDFVSSYYARDAKILVKFAIEANNRGEYYPIWGVCQGFQLMSILLKEIYLHNPNQSDNWLTRCDSVDEALNLDFNMSEIRKSRMFSNSDDKVLNILRNEQVTPNYHHWCLTPQNLTASNLSSIIRPITTNKDKNGKTFISTYESINESQPIYAVQWHPEKNPFVFFRTQGHENIPHTFDSVLIAQYFANFFVNESRKNKHHFTDTAEENKYLIFNWNPSFFKDGKQDDAEYFSQVYEFAFNTIQNNTIVKIIKSALGL